MQENVVFCIFGRLWVEKQKTWFKVKNTVFLESSKPDKVCSHQNKIGFENIKLKKLFMNFYSQPQ